MSKRFINCTACKGCHTGRGGKFCPFLTPNKTGVTAGSSAMAMADPDAPDRDSADYESYLSRRITEEESCLKSLQDQTRVIAMEAQLARLKLQTAALSPSPSGSHHHGEDLRGETGVAASFLAASRRVAAGAGGGSLGGLDEDGPTPQGHFSLRPKE